MLCPECRRQVGRDGYCPSGHLAAPERAAPNEAQFPPPPVSQTAPPVPGSPPSIPSVPGISAAPSRGGRPLAVTLTFVLLVAGVLGYLAFGPSASAANLKYVFDDGETHRYGLSMTFNMDAGSAAFGGGSFTGSVDMILSQKTTTVAKDGIATIQYAVERTRVTVGKDTVTVPAPAAPLTIRMAPDGHVLEARGNSLLTLGDSDPVSDLSGLFGPEAFGPILPDHKVDPGDSWKIDEEMANPLGEKIHYQGTATLVRRDLINGQDAAVIRSETNTPLNFGIKLADLAKVAKGALPNELKNAGMAFNGYFTTNFTQSLATRSGFLLSAIGDLKMTGTIVFDDFPEVGDLSAVFTMLFQVTMTSLS